MGCTPPPLSLLPSADYLFHRVVICLKDEGRDIGHPRETVDEYSSAADIESLNNDPLETFTLDIRARYSLCSRYV